MLYIGLSDIFLVDFDFVILFLLYGDCLNFDFLLYGAGIAVSGLSIMIRFIILTGLCLGFMILVMNILRYIAGIFYPNTQLKIADNLKQYD